MKKGNLFICIFPFTAEVGWILIRDHTLQTISEEKEENIYIE